MAVYFNLAIDCDQDAKSAEELARMFSDFKITTEQFGVLACNSEHTLPRFYWGNRGTPAVDTDAANWHKVCVHPNGMSMPAGPVQRDILDEKNMNYVRKELYRRLRHGIDLGHQFRSAAFGCEFQDVLGESDWMERVESTMETGKLPVGMEGLILRAELVKNESVKIQLEHFADSYLWWNAASPGY